MFRIDVTNLKTGFRFTEEYDTLSSLDNRLAVYAEHTDEYDVSWVDTRDLDDELTDDRCEFVLTMRGYEAAISR